MNIKTASYLMLSRKSRLRFLAGGNVRETCCEERVRREARIPRTRSLMFPCTGGGGEMFAGLETPTN